jgi:hypothetical protein
MLGIMAVVLDSMMLCCAAYCGERYAVQHVEFSDMMYSMMMCCAACWVSWLLYWAAYCWVFAACCGERYVLQQVVFSGMVEVGQNDTLVGMLGIMLRWAA